MEYVALTPDTSESDLKQRREILEGDTRTTVFVLVGTSGCEYGPETMSITATLTVTLTLTLTLILP